MHTPGSTRYVARTAVTRRAFLRGGSVAALFSIVPAHVLGRGTAPPSEKLNVAAVGLGVMGAKNVAACAAQNIVALCDVDWQMASTTFQKYPNAKKYRDFRRMLDQESAIDAVIVATPDHTHAVVTAAAIRRGKHVYTQMPLAHDVAEVRQLADLAKRAGVTTQMGNERFSATTIRSVCEWLWDGVIGPVHEVHCWTNRPQWPQGIERPSKAQPVPSQLNWDLWLGPAPARPYHSVYHPYGWRGWQDFGTGALGAMGCHTLDAAFWALRLDQAETLRIHADTTPRFDETYPTAATVRFEFSARGDMPAVTLNWYDGGRQPPRPPEWPATREFMGSNGTLFVGAKGKLVYGGVMAGTHPGQAGPWLLPEQLMRDYSRPPRSIPRVKAAGARWVEYERHEQEWLECCRTGKTPSSNFAVAAPLTEIALLGNIAVCTGETISWTAKSRLSDAPASWRQRLRREYRKGWSL